jgi:ATP-dependent RNA helicase RhlE
LQAFRAGQIRILIATDIAARGIDVSGVSHVFNFELPNVPEQYVHRIGRTARAGREGIAISFVDGEERGWLRQIERLTRVQLEPMPLPADFAAEVARLPRPVQAKPTAQRRHEEARRDRPSAPRPEGERRRRFGGRKPSGVGAHKGAVQRNRGR